MYELRKTNLCRKKLKSIDTLKIVYEDFVAIQIDKFNIIDLFVQPNKLKNDVMVHDIEILVQTQDLDNETLSILNNKRSIVAVELLSNHEVLDEYYVSWCELGVNENSKQENTIEKYTTKILIC